MWSRHPALGIDFQPYSMLWRLAGVDHMHVHGLAGKFAQDDDEVVHSARDCLTPLADAADAADVVMPAFSSGQWAGTLAPTLDAVPSADLMFMCGGGILAHPMGPAAGVTSVRQAWARLATRPAAWTLPPRHNPNCARRSTSSGRSGTDGDGTALRVVRRRLHRRLGHAGHAGCGRRSARCCSCAVPTPAQLEAAGPLDALGIAGIARALAPDAMRAELAPVAALLRRAGTGDHALQVLLDFRQRAGGRQSGHRRGGAAAARP